MKKALAFYVAAGGLTLTLLSIPNANASDTGVGAAPPPPPPPPTGTSTAPFLQPPPPLPRGYVYQTGPIIMPYNDGDLIPEGYHVHSEPRRAVWITGISVLTGFYSLTVIAGTADGTSDGRGALYVPVLGPFIAEALAENCDFCMIRTIMYVADGLLQTTGAALFIGGLMMDDKKELRRNDIAKGGRFPEVMVGPGMGSLRWRF